MLGFEESEIVWMQHSIGEAIELLRHVKDSQISDRELVTTGLNNAHSFFEGLIEEGRI